MGGLDDDGAAGEGGDDAVAEDEPGRGGVVTGWEFADDEALAGDAVDEGGVPAG